MTFNELKDKFKTYIGDRSDDETIQIITDFTEYENGLPDGNSDEYITKIASEQAVNEAVRVKEEEWRKKYIDTFFKGKLEDETNDNDNKEEENNAEKIKIEDCFVNEEEK